MSDGVASFQRRWGAPRPPLDSIEERVAIRLADEPDTETRTITRETLGGAVTRLFVMVSPGRWRSGYVHRIADVDRILAAVPIR